MREDPNIYKTLDFCGYSASRHFPNMQLPVPGAPSVSDSAQQPTQHQFIKAYLTKSKLNEHSKVHTIGRLPCEHCNKLFAQSKTLSVHKKTCSKCPGADNLTKEEKKPHKCPHCTKRYTHVSDVVRHCKSKHPGI